MLGYIKKGNTINLGSGKGEMACFFKEKVSNIVNNDLYYGDLKFNLNKHFKLASKLYDNVIAGEVIEHLENPSFFISECSRITKNGGRIIITTPNMTGLAYILSDYIGDDAFPHINAFNGEMLKILLKKNGFNKILFYSYLECFWKNNLFFRTLSYLFPRLRSNIIIVAEK